MKPEDIKPCAACNKGVMHDGNIVFYRATLAQELIDLDAVRQLHGMEMMLGKAAPLARVMSPVSQISQETWNNTILLCQSCLLEGFDLVRAFPGD